MEVKPTRPPSSPRPSLTCPASLEASSWCCVCRPEDSLPCGFSNPKSRAAMTPCECADKGLLVYSTPCWPVVSTAPCRLYCCLDYLTLVYNLLHTNRATPVQPHPQKNIPSIITWTFCFLTEFNHSSDVGRITFISWSTLKPCLSLRRDQPQWGEDVWGTNRREASTNTWSRDSSSCDSEFIYLLSLVDFWIDPSACPCSVGVFSGALLVHNTEKHSNIYLCFQNISAKSDNQCAI